jgi:hypothetical protein
MLMIKRPAIAAASIVLHLRPFRHMKTENLHGTSSLQY